MRVVCQHECHPMVFLSNFQLQLQPHLCKPHIKTPLLLNVGKAVTFSTKTARLRITRTRKNNDFENENDPVEPAFINEKGAVDDMEGYLNSLSLEYDSVWDTKPSWCQPWTIVLTGTFVIGCSWLILHSVLVTLLASSLICAWWFIFLYSYPKAYEEMIAERRKKVISGAEDTYGWSKN